MTPLQEALELQKKIKKARGQNPDIPDPIIAKRFGIGLYKMKQLLADEVPYPSSYKQTAKRIGRTVEEVAEHREQGMHWCTHCKDWFPLDQLKVGGSNTKHAAAHCEGRKRKRKQSTS